MTLYKFINENCGRNEQHRFAYEMLSHAFEKFYGISEYNIAKGEHGKPYIKEYPEIHFNISHCKGLAVCGISDGNIGVDAEFIRDFDARVMKRIFSENERDLVVSSEKQNEIFFRIWTLKEALGKYLGTGIFSDLKKYSFSFENGYPVCENMKNVFFTQFMINKNWTVSICADSPENNIVQL